MGHCRIAKVDVPLGHHFARSVGAFRRKTQRRIDDFLYWRKLRRYPWLSAGKTALVRFTLYTVLVVPLIVQAGRGWLRVRDRAWLYHLIVCWITLYIYGKSVIRSRFRSAPHSREGWQH